ncbi:MAG: sugar phosphate isomerase/epimerase [Clostridia bacterium]|nr:sugar phosphate isomerase/epimerase [Clostridia bacterium]
MKLGAMQSVFAGYGDRCYQKMKEFGFDAVDYNIDGELNGMTEEEYDAEILRQKALMEEASVIPHQVHGPWRFPPHDETEEARAERMEAMKRSLRCTALLGSRYWVIHPLMPFGSRSDGNFEEFWQINLDFFRKLLPTAKQYGIIICFENMPMRSLSISPVSKTLEFIREINDESFQLCLDTGHGWIRGTTPGDAVRMAGKTLKVLHVHDNLQLPDPHLVPGMGTIDWKDFVAALRETGFDGVFSLECEMEEFLPGLSDDIKFRALRVIADGLLAEN